MTAPDFSARNNFIREMVAADVESRRYGRQVATRFPPEPNGYLHIGHAKSICLNFGIANEFGGRCNLRFDDTNPFTEDIKYVNAIREDVKWLGFTWAEERYATEPADDVTPDRLFQRRWAITVLERSLQLTGAEFVEDGKGELFAALQPFLGFTPEPPRRYEELAAQFAQPVGTLKSHVSRLRQRWREILFEQVAMTLDDSDPEKIRAELAELLTCV